MSAPVIRFPLHRIAAVLVLGHTDGWLVLPRDHRWIHGDRRSALVDAHWLAWNLGLTVREPL